MNHSLSKVIELGGIHFLAIDTSSSLDDDMTAGLQHRSLRVPNTFSFRSLPRNGLRSPFLLFLYKPPKHLNT